MSRKFRGRRVGVVAAAVALASLGGVDVMLVSSGRGSGQELAAAAAAQSTPSASSQVLASPSPTSPTATATVPAPPKVVEKAPPVVDGVRRANVGSAHSPRLTQQLSAAPVTMSPPAEAGAVGVDVADYQHAQGAAIDWPQVAGAGYKFAFIKATEGDYYVNPYYASDLAEAKAAGLYATGYHFAIPNVSDGVSQADYDLANGGYTPDGRTLPLALDIEYNPYGSECYGLSPTQMVAWLSAFTGEVQRVTGQRPIVYTTADWWDTCTGASTAFGADPLWVAAYRSGSPPMPAGWGSWTFWQYTSRGSVPGINGNVDVSYFLQAAEPLLETSNQPGSRHSPASPVSSASRKPFLLPSSGSASPSGSPTASPSDSASPSPSPSDSTSPSPSPSPSGSPSPSPSGSPSPSDSASATPPASPSPSASPSPAPST